MRAAPVRLKQAAERHPPSDGAHKNDMLRKQRSSSLRRFHFASASRSSAYLTTLRLHDAAPYHLDRPGAWPEYDSDRNAANPGQPVKAHVSHSRGVRQDSVFTRGLADEESVDL